MSDSEALQGIGQYSEIIFGKVIVVVVVVVCDTQDNGITALEMCLLQLSLVRFLYLIFIQ